MAFFYVTPLFSAGERRVLLDIVRCGCDENEMCGEFLKTMKKL
jgi:hypothetical protein